MTLKELLAELSHDVADGARHVVIANQATGQRHEIDFVTTDSLGVLNIVTDGTCAGYLHPDVAAQDEGGGDESC